MATICGPTTWDVYERLDESLDPRDPARSRTTTVITDEVDIVLLEKGSTTTPRRAV